MANVLQYGKRGRYLPRLKSGRVNTRSEYMDNEDCPDLPERVMPPMLYSVEISERGSFSGNGEEYKAQFTEEEMLQIAGEWLTLLSQNRAEKRRKANEFKARNG